MSEDKNLPRFWPLKWLLDETFWRDIAAQAIGTAVVVAAGFVWASAAGYLSPRAQNVGDHWLAVLIGVALIAIGIVQVFAVVYSVREMRRREGGSQFGYGLLLIILMLVMQGAVAVPFLIGVFNGRYA